MTWYKIKWGDRSIEKAELSNKVKKQRVKGCTLDSGTP